MVHLSWIDVFRTVIPSLACVKDMSISPRDIDELIEREDWFPFVETWSKKTAAQMFDTLVKSEIEVVEVSFTPDEFKFSIPQRFRKAIPRLKGEAILTHDIDNKDYREMNAIGEFYMEDLRLETSRRRFKKDTPIEMWDRDKKQIVELARRKYGPDAGPYEIRNAVFSFTKESNPFRPSVALAIYCILNATRILDMSAGWGDRLIGAMAWAVKSGKQIRYQGYDPFAELHPRYADMIQDFAPEGSRFDTTIAPFEDAEIEESAFDLAFTSPPYFDFEEYGLSKTTSRENQSTVRYPTLAEWVDGFLKTMMRRAARMLRIGGHLAINIEGPFMHNLLENSGTMFTEVRMEYVGIIGYTSDEPKDHVVHPTFVWRRIA